MEGPTDGGDDERRCDDEPGVVIAPFDGTGAATIRALGDLWWRASVEPARRTASSRTDAFAAVRSCAADAVWTLGGTSRGVLVSMGFAVRLREADGAGPPEPGKILLRCVAVDPSHRERGLGERTVRGLLDLARAAACVEARLWVGDANASAGRLYARIGFAVTGRRQPDGVGGFLGERLRRLERPKDGATY